MTERLEPKERRERILQAAMIQAERTGYRVITSKQVADAAGLKSHGLINHYFGSIDGLRHAIIQRAITDENLEIIIQGLVTRDNAVLGIPVELKRRALSVFDSEV